MPPSRGQGRRGWWPRRVTQLEASLVATPTPSAMPPPAPTCWPSPAPAATGRGRLSLRRLAEQYGAGTVTDGGRDRPHRGLPAQAIIVTGQRCSVHFPELPPLLPPSSSDSGFQPRRKPRNRWEEGEEAGRARRDGCRGDGARVGGWTGDGRTYATDTITNSIGSRSGGGRASGGTTATFLSVAESV
jgi:hypothetical protein